MDSADHFQALRLEVQPSPETNDFEVRLFGDGADLIERYWSDMMGLDPDDILVEPCPLSGNNASDPVTIVRCSCGVIGCDSVEIMIQRSEDRVAWLTRESTSGVPLQLS